MELPAAFLVAFAYTTAIVYYVDSGHLNPLQLVALGTVLEVSYFVAQLPTGVVADLVSRRACVVVGWILEGIGFAEQGFSAGFGNLVAAQAVFGIGAALQAGAQDAWIADELDEEAMTPVYVRATQLGLVGTVGGAALSGIVASQRLYLPMLLGGIGICLVGVVLAFVLPQNTFRRATQGAEEPERRRGIVGRSWEMFAGQIRESRVAVLAVPGFALLLGATFFAGMWSESFDRLWGDFLIRDIRFPVVFGLSPTAWFSVVAVVVAVLGLGSTEIANRRIDRLGHAAVAGTLLVVTVLIGVGVLVMTSAHGFAPAIAAYLVVQVLRPVAYPLVTGWIVSRVDARVRATALSARDMFDSGGQIIGGPVVGWIGVVGTVRAALYAGAVALAPAIALLVAATRRVPALPPEDAGSLGEVGGPGESGAAAGQARNRSGG
ncbi:MAG TPA: MFS transporter [Actinocrinis sp.]|nr:MFS transporter [Actinocrinis sp.]